METDSAKVLAIRRLLQLVTASAVGESGKLQKSGVVSVVNMLHILPEANTEDESQFGNLFDETNALEQVE
jgi:hypothetical protein